MLRKSILCALASAALIPAAVAAHPGGGGGGGGPSGMGGQGNMGGFGNSGMGGFGNNGMGSSMRDQGRMNSQGPANASAVGIDHSDRNSVLFGTSSTKTISAGTFAGLKTGATLFSNGTAVGTVQQIRTNASGTPVVLVIKGTNGGFYAVPAHKLTFSGGALSTTARLAGINNTTTVAATNQARLNSQGRLNASATGIAHANQHSVLANASSTVAANSQARLNSQGPFHASAMGLAHANQQHSVLANAAARTRLSGVSVGTPLFSGGVQVGTVTKVVTTNGVVTRVIVQGTNGRTFSLNPRTLVAANGSLTTSARLHGI